MNSNLIYDQCDQIGLFFKGFGNKFCIKSILIFVTVLAILKNTSLNKSAVATFLSNFVKNSATFISTSGPTVYNISPSASGQPCTEVPTYLVFELAIFKKEKVLLRLISVQASSSQSLLLKN